MTSCITKFKDALAREHAHGIANVKAEIFTLNVVESYCAERHVV